MSPAVQDTKRTRGRPKGSKDRVARKSALTNHEDARQSPPKSSSSTPAPPSKRPASSSGEPPSSNAFTPINQGDRNTSRSGRELSKTRKFAHETSEPESLGPALKKRVSARSTSRPVSAGNSARKRLPDHGSQPGLMSMVMASPGPQVAPSAIPPFGAHGYRSLYGSSPYGTPATNGAGRYPHGREINFPINIPDHDPPINTIQPAPGSMPAPRRSLPAQRTALPGQPVPSFQSLPIITRPMSEVYGTYQELYKDVHKNFKSFERYTWNVKIRNLTRSVFVKLATMRSRRTRLAWVLKELKVLKKSGMHAVDMDLSTIWPPFLEEHPHWYGDMTTPALRADVHNRMAALSSRIAYELGGYEKAKMNGLIMRREKGTVALEEMKAIDLNGQMREFASMSERLANIDVRPQNTGSSSEK